MEEESRQESTKTILRGITRCADLIEKYHPEIAKKIKAKDVPIEEKISELQKIVEVHVTRKGVQVHIEASKQGERSK